MIITLEDTEEGLNERLISVRFGVKWCKSSQPGTVREDKLMPDQFSGTRKIDASLIVLSGRTKKGKPCKMTSKSNNNNKTLKGCHFKNIF